MLKHLIAVAGSITVGLGMLLATAGAASASTTCHSVTHTTYKTERVVRHHHVVKVLVKVVHKTTTCTVTGATGPQGATGPAGSSYVAPVLTVQQAQDAWALATGNAAYYKVLNHDANTVLASDASALYQDQTWLYDSQQGCAYEYCDPSVPPTWPALPDLVTIQANLAADLVRVQADGAVLVTDATAALGDVPPGNLAAPWAVMMTAQAASGQSLVADPGSAVGDYVSGYSSAAYTQASQARAAFVDVAGSDGLVGIS